MKHQPMSTEVSDLTPSQQRQMQSAKRSLDELAKNPRLDGVTIKGHAVSGSGTEAIAHKLGRQPVGWAITDMADSFAQINREAWDDKTITLTFSGSTVVDIEVW